MSAAALSPDLLFRLANLAALLGWATLAFSIALRAPRLQRLAGLGLPLALSVVYTALIAVHWSSADGGFGSLPQVAALFASPWMLLAGWIHYLAFDLFVGAWIASDAEARRMPRWLLLPVLPVTFLFGPAGLLLWFAIRSAARADLPSSLGASPHVR